jgi:hypothetical protein
MRQQGMSPPFAIDFMAEVRGAPSSFESDPSHHRGRNHNSNAGWRMLERTPTLHATDLTGGPESWLGTPI